MTLTSRGNRPANGRYRHPTLWLHDGDLILVVENCGFKVHRNIVDDWQTPALSGWTVHHDDVAFKLAEFAQEGCDVVYIAPEKTPLQGGDVEALLEHLYGRNG